MGVLGAVQEKLGKSSILGFNKKAVLEIGDFGDLRLVESKSEKPSAGAGAFSPQNVGSFNASAIEGFAKSLGLSNGGGFELYGSVKRYRFEVQFNPNEIYINGYGGEELPIQNYHPNEDGKEKSESGNGEQKPNMPVQGEVKHGSTMAAANTRIDMNFKLVFDKSNPQDAFFSDKFTLSQTNLAKGALRAGLKAANKISNSVQPEVEALTAIVRDKNKRLARFTWGDMVYEGVITTVSAEYVMFNPNGEPCRAFVSINMVLFDKEVGGAYTDIWKKEYMEDIRSIANPADLIKPNL